MKTWLGFLAGALTATGLLFIIATPNRFVIEHNSYTFIKYDRWTGKSWKSWGGSDWTPITLAPVPEDTTAPPPPKGYTLDVKPDIFDKLAAAPKWAQNRPLTNGETLTWEQATSAAAYLDSK